MAKYRGSKLADGTPLNKAVYTAYRNAGLSHNQALAITAEVGRENGFNAGTLFGSHTDPAANSRGGAIRNVGMLSWNQGRDSEVLAYLKSQGQLVNGAMPRTQANLDAQARFSVMEMKRPRYANKLTHFWRNPNASPESFAKELGRNYIVWAYGQNTIKGKGGGRVPFNWGAHDSRRRGYLNTLSGMLGGSSNYTAPSGGQSGAYERAPLISVASLQASQPTYAPIERAPLVNVADLDAAEPIERPGLINVADLMQPNDNDTAYAAPQSMPLFNVSGENMTPNLEQIERPPLISIADLGEPIAYNAPEYEVTDGEES